MMLKPGTSILILFLLTLAGCAAGNLSLPTIVPLPTDTLVPTPSATPLPTDTLAPSPTSSPTLTPTPAPVTYTVTEKDDMFGVALRYGISLDELKAANPTVIPNMMSVGTVLTIPITPTPPATGTNPELPVQTPDPFSPLCKWPMAPICYQDALGGAYCFAQLENTSESPVEKSLCALYSECGRHHIEMDGILPLNILPRPKGRCPP